jgi:hypothetical protein
MQRLRVSDNGRFLIHEDGTPFFWLGDTAWALFQKSRREDAPEQPSVLRYLEDRAAKGFTMIQARLTDDETTTDIFGRPAFVNGDFTRPCLYDGKDNDYWDYCDWLIGQACAHSLRLALLPIWASHIPPGHPLEKVPKTAYQYGRFLGNRYGSQPHIVWVLGGDPWPKGTDVDHTKRLSMIRAMAEGIADGACGNGTFDGIADYSKVLMTYHPKGGNHSSSEKLHNEPWLHFNMIQTTTRFRFFNYRTVGADYALTPVKPTLDAEVAYEWSKSLNKKEPQDLRTGPWEARKAAYWNLFAGGFGHTYGHRSFILWCCKGESLKYGANLRWYDNLNAPGSIQMGHLRKLFEDRPFLTRIPDQGVITEGENKGMERAVATRDREGAFAMVYLPTGNPVTVRMDTVRSRFVKAAWFDPREGTFDIIDQYRANGTRRFTPPTQGKDHDWVLILESIEETSPN